MKLPGRIREVWLNSWLNPFFLIKKRGMRLLERESETFGGIMLDIGCGDRPFYSLFKDRVNKYIGMDITSNIKWKNKIDCFADARFLPFRKSSLDNVFSSYTLGDNEEPSKIMAEISRVLKPGGRLFLLEAQWWPLHDEPSDYWRFTRYSLRYLAQAHSLNVLKIEPIGGGYLSLGLHLNYHLFYHCGLKSPVLLAVMFPLYILIQFVADVLDSVCMLEDDPPGYLLVAQKV